MTTADFAARFAQAWQAPTAEGLCELLDPDVVLHQPHLPALRGKPAALAEFQRLLRWLPTLYGIVDRACERDDLVFLEWRMMFPIGQGGLALPAVDRFVLRAGLGIERRVYFDQTALVRAVLGAPRQWPGFLRYRFDR